MAHETFLQSIWKHGLRSPYIQKILNSAPVSNWVKGVTGSGLTNAEIEQNLWNSEEAEKQRVWTEQMDNTKYQRQTSDMMAAGLNPAMMYGGSVSASAPSGAAASGGDAGNPSGGLVSSILDIIFAKQRMKNLRAEEHETESRASLNDANTKLSEANEQLVAANERLQSLIADYYPTLTEATVKEINAKVDNLFKDLEVKDTVIDKNKAEKIFTEVKTDIERINKEWLPRLNEATEKAQKSKAAKDYADAAWQTYFKEYTESHAGVTPGYSQITGFVATLATTIEECFGDAKEYISDLIPDWLKRKRNK